MEVPAPTNVAIAIVAVVVDDNVDVDEMHDDTQDGRYAQLHIRLQKPHLLGSWMHQKGHVLLRGLAHKLDSAA
jgi:hypothetical protein